MRAIVNKLRKIVMEISVRLGLKIILILKPTFQMSYDNRDPKDGTGAQVQRLIGIYCLSTYLNVPYVHTGIKDVSTHALDPFQDEHSRKLFVARVNRIFDFQSSSTMQIDPIYLDKLTLRKLLKITLENKITRKQSILSIVEPFGIIDYFPRIYDRIPAINFELGKSITSKFGKIVIHYRHGVGGFAHYHNQSVSRQLHDSYYLDSLELLKQDVDFTRKIILFTDAPLKTINFTPPPEQIKNWVGSPNFDGEKIRIEKSEVADIFLNSGLEIEFVHGGDPLEALAIMANAKILIIGRSSLSYVGGLLNKNGKIIYPRSFWHSPLRGWLKINA